jgi:hypothetical protein
MQSLDLLLADLALQVLLHTATLASACCLEPMHEVLFHAGAMDVLDRSFAVAGTGNARTGIVLEADAALLALPAVEELSLGHIINFSRDRIKFINHPCASSSLSFNRGTILYFFCGSFGEI